MLSFSQFIIEVELTKARQGLPHIFNQMADGRDNSMPHSHFHELLHQHNGHIPLHMTGKTDGATFQVGHDSDGFWSRSSSSGSQKMRSKQDYHDRVSNRERETGKPGNRDAAEAFGDFHEKLASNKGLRKHLEQVHKRDGFAQVRGEMFHRPSAKKVGGGKEQFVNTPYPTKKMGKTGMLVVHSQLPGNEPHGNLERHNDDHITFGSDRIEHPPTSVDVTDVATKHKELDHDLINSRTTKTNKEAKQAEVDKLTKLKKEVHRRVKKAVVTLKPKDPLGAKTHPDGIPGEGLVLHPPRGAEGSPVKLVSGNFLAARNAKLAAARAARK